MNGNSKQFTNEIKKKTTSYVFKKRKIEKKKSTYPNRIEIVLK